MTTMWEVTYWAMKIGVNKTDKVPALRRLTSGGLLVTKWYGTRKVKQIIIIFERIKSLS